MEDLNTVFLFCVFHMGFVLTAVLITVSKRPKQTKLVAVPNLNEFHDQTG